MRSILLSFLPRLRESNSIAELRLSVGGPKWRNLFQFMALVLQFILFTGYDAPPPPLTPAQLAHIRPASTSSLSSASGGSASAGPVKPIKTHFEPLTAAAANPSMPVAVAVAAPPAPAPAPPTPTAAAVAAVTGVGVPPSPSSVPRDQTAELERKLKEQSVGKPSEEELCMPACALFPLFLV